MSFVDFGYIGGYVLTFLANLFSMTVIREYHADSADKSLRFNVQNNHSCSVYFERE